MKRFFSLLLMAVAFYCNSLSAQEAPLVKPKTLADTAICYLRDAGGRIREHNVDFIRMLLDVKFKAKEGKVIGNVKYDFRPIQYVCDTLFLDAPGINVTKVLLDGKEAKYRVDSPGLTILFPKSLDWNKQYKLDITYDVVPHKGIYFIGWKVDAKNETNDPYFTRHQIWTQGQGTDNRFWFPCYDDVNDKLITETVITFDTAYTVVSNGVLKSKKPNKDGTQTWHYAMSKPMVPYLVMIGIDKYAYKDYKSKNGMISRQYYYSDRPETVEPTYRYSAEMMDWLSSEFGVAYPWETYANVPVQDFMYGAMENTSATVYGDFLLTSPRAGIERPYVHTNAHELTHQWCGDYVTEYSPAHHWLHESFATYYAKQFMHKTFGDDWYEWNKRSEAVQAINADRADRYPIADSRGGSPRVYPKGSFVLDMIRYTIGDSVYKRVISSYLKEHAYGNVSNHDLQFAFMDYAGINLDWFFDQWVYRTGIPNYNVSYTRQADKVVFTVIQTHLMDEMTSAFKMPIVYEVHCKDGSTYSKRAWTNGPADTIAVDVPAGKEVDYTLFDPSSNVLKTTYFQRTYEELCAQAAKATHMLDRYDAILALETYDADKKRDFLISLFDKEKSAYNKNEMLRQLGKDHHEKTVALFKKAMADADFTVRKQAIEVLDDIPVSLQASTEKLLVDTSYYTIESALRKLCRAYPDKQAQYLAQVGELKGINNNVRIAWLELTLKANMLGQGAQAEIKELTGYTSNRYEFRTRVKAAEALERMNYCDEDVLLNLMNASTYTNNRLNGPSTRILKAFLQNPVQHDKAKALLSLASWTEWERKILEKIIN